MQSPGFLVFTVLHQQMSFSRLFRTSFNIFSRMFLLVTDFCPFPILLMDKIYYAWHIFLACAPITGLKLSSLTCTTGFYSPRHKAKGGPHATEFWRSSNAKMKCSNRYSSNSRWKKWGRLSQLHLNFFPKVWLINCLLSTTERTKRAMFYILVT